MTIGIAIFVLFLLNTIVLAIIFVTRRKVAEVSRWPSTMGTVVVSRIEQRPSDDDDDDDDGGYTDYPDVQYSYQVGGQTYQGHKIAPGPEVGGTGAGEVVARYPVGAQVTVFYNPQNPSDAVLERNAPAQLWLWVILIIFDCAIIWWVLKQ